MSGDMGPEGVFSTPDLGFLADPYPEFARLRAGPPIFWSASECGWVLHRYGDIAAILADSRFTAFEVAQCVRELCARANKDTADLEAVLSEMLFLLNPPEHSEARQFLVAALTGRPVSSHAAIIETITRRLLTKAVRHQPWDAVGQYADLLPPLFMAHLFGLTEVEIMGLTALVSELTKSADRGRSLRFYQRVSQQISSARCPLDAAVLRRRQRPLDDVLSRMIALSDDRFHLDDRTIATRALFLMMAAIETTSSLIGNAIAAVVEHEDAIRCLEADPEHIVPAIEETLRFDSPIQQVSRVASVNAMIAGQKISAGDRLILLIGAANRDPAVYAEPDRFDIRRTMPRHLAFGAGAHFCPGSGLARLEAQIALREFLKSRPRAVNPAARRWRQHRTLRRLATFPVLLQQ